VVLPVIFILDAGITLKERVGEKEASWTLRRDFGGGVVVWASIKCLAIVEGIGGGCPLKDQTVTKEKLRPNSIASSSATERP
jgi:hypothetical protein